MVEGRTIFTGMIGVFIFSDGMLFSAFLLQGLVVFVHSFISHLVFHILSLPYYTFSQVQTFF
jgi:hypothetical protein